MLTRMSLQFNTLLLQTTEYHDNNEVVRSSKVGNDESVTNRKARFMSLHKGAKIGLNYCCTGLRRLRLN